MHSNILRAIKNISDFGKNDLKHYTSTYLIRINAAGEALEFYVKDAFCNSFTKAKYEKEESHRKCFSWLGNQNFPPDLIIKNGDAFEIKKILSKLSFIEKKKQWGSYFQGGIIAIPEDDYCLIVKYANLNSD